MILSQTEINIIGVFLQDAVFGLDKNETKQVLGVLTLGNQKHADAKTSVFSHLRRGMSHLQKEHNDTETGLPNRAHGIARILLGLITACRNEVKS